MKNKVSVIIRFHEQTKLEELSICLLSLQAQEYQNVEPVIVTQRFSEQDVKAIETLLSRFDWAPEVDPRVINCDRSEPNDLRCVLLNIGISATKDSRYLAILDYDDFCGKEHYSRLISALDSSDAAIAYSGMITVEQVNAGNFHYTLSKKFEVKRDFSKNQLYRSPHFQMACFVIDRSRVDETDLVFDELTVYEEDYHLHLKLLKKYAADFTVAAERVPALMRVIRTDGSNSIVTVYDDPETRERKVKEREKGRKLTRYIRGKHDQEEFDPMVMLWIEPLPIRGGRAYNSIIYNFGLANSEIPKRNRYGHFELCVPPEYSSITEAIGPKGWSFRHDKQDCDELRDMLYPNHDNDWNKSSVDKWCDLVKGRGPIFEKELEMLDKARLKYPFQKVLTWGENGAVDTYCKENDLDRLFLELGPTRAPFAESAHCDPFGVNGNSVFSVLPQDAILPDDFKNNELKTFVARMGYDVVRPDEIISDFIDLDKKTVLFPLQLADDLNFLLHAPKYDRSVDFLKEYIPQFLDAGWKCIIRPHPHYVRSDYNIVDTETSKEWVELQENENLLWYNEANTKTTQLGLLRAVDAVVSVNSSMAFEAILMGTCVKLAGNSSFMLETYNPNLDQIFNQSQRSEIIKLQKNLAAFNLYHNLFPLGEVYLPHTLHRRMYEATELRNVYEKTGSGGLLQFMLENGRSRNIDYFTLGNNPVLASQPKYAAQNGRIKFSVAL